MFGWMLEVINSGVIDSPMTGGNSPDGSHGGFNSDILILILIVFIAGFAIGFGIRHLIQKFKEAPNEPNNKKGE